MTSIKETVKKVCQLLNKHEVEYLVIGGFAVIHHGYPRATADIDFWYRPTVENFLKLLSAFDEYGVDTTDLRKIVFDSKKTFLRVPQLGIITEFLPRMEGLESFQDAKKRAVETTIEGVEVFVIGYDDLLINKQKVNRLKDQLDIEELRKRKESNSDEQ